MLDPAEQPLDIGSVAHDDQRGKPSPNEDFAKRPMHQALAQRDGNGCCQ